MPFNPCFRFFKTATRRISVSRYIPRVFSQVKRGTLVLDIDNVVMRVSQQLGRDEWFHDRIARFIKEGHDSEVALEKAVKIYNKVQHHSEVIFADRKANIVKEISMLRKRGVNIIGLTSRNHAIAEPTLRQLTSLGFNFCQNVLKPGAFIFQGKKVQIRDGIIFCNGRHKGHCLLTASEQHSLIPFLDDEVHFIDDSLKHCRHVRDTLAEQDVEAFITHYPHTARTQPFGAKEREIADIQEAHLMSEASLLLSDEEVISALTTPTITPLAKAS